MRSEITGIMEAIFLLLFGFHLASGSVVSNVRLVEPIPYMINVITETVHRIEDIDWSTLKIPDVTVDVDESVFGEPVKGTVTYKNGFVVSIRQVDILQQSLGQIWRFDNAANTTTVQITGTLRMVDVTLGFDVEANLSNGVHHHTSELIMPLFSFDTRIIKDMFAETIDVTVTPTVTRTNNKMVFLPASTITYVYGNLFDALNFVTPGVAQWASDVIRPYVLDVVENAIPFPAICYDCPS